MTEFISPIYDTTFKYLWKNNDCRRWITRLVELIAHIDLNEYTLYDAELNSGNKRKDYRMDILFLKGSNNIEDANIFNVEMYKDHNKYNDTKSLTYIFRLMSTGYNSGERYSNRYGIQINFHNYYCNENKNTSIAEYRLRDKNSDLEKDNVTIYDVYLPKFKGICYNEDNELGAMLSLLGSESFEEMERVAAGNKEALNIVAELVKLVDDENFIGMYDYEKEHQKQMNSARYEGYQEGYEKGIEKGIEKGKNETKKEDAITFLKNGASYELVSKSLGFSIEELKKLQEEVEDK